MRRQHTATQDPDVEASRAELGVLEGHKNTVQTETLAIAQNKKRLEADAAETVANLEQQIKNKKEELATADAAHVRRMSVIHSEENIAIVARDTAVSAREQVEKDLKVVADEVSRLKHEEAGLKKSVSSLQNECKVIEDSIARLAPQVRILEKKKAALTADVSKEAQKIVNLNAGAIEVNARLEELKKEVATVDSQIIESKDEVKGLLSRKEGLLADVLKTNEELSEVQKKKVTHETEMQSREKEANSRMEQAALLEEAVGKHLTLLKEAENQFTVEHLARMGYKPIS